jgi:UDP-4-amino-4-deoxy-L-arabinose-oxoglutarate aminotransferase
MIPYARPSIGEAEIAEVEACLRSGWLATGPRAARFEELLAARLGTRHALGASSGTAALHLALLAAGVGPGDEVVTTPMTWVATGNVILHAGAKPVFVDVERDTMNLDASLVEPAITPQTRAVLPVHFAGQPCDEDALLAVCRAHGLKLVEDASFHPAKNVTTGEGGAVATDDDEIAARVRQLRFFGLAQSPESRFGGRGHAAYDVVEAGFKYNFSDLQAAIGIHQLAKLDAMNARRSELAALYREQLARVPHVAPLGSAPYPHEHAWHLMVVRVDADALTIDRDGFIQGLREAGVGAGLHFVPLHLMTLYREMAGDPRRLPVATEAHRGILTLPLFPEMTERDVGFVVDAVAKLVAEHARAGSAVARRRASGGSA